MASVKICGIRGRINTFCLFFSALCAYLSPTDLADFHRFFAYQASPSCDILPYNSPHAKKSVAIRCAGGASKPSGRQRSKSKRSVKRPIRAHREIRVFDKSSPHGHSTSHMPHATFNIQHSTPNIPHPTLHILNIPPQNLHGFFPPRPTLRSNTPFSHIFATV